MPGTRSSARLAEKQSSPPAASQETKDNKRKADDSQSSPSKKGRKNTAEQKTLEETFKPTEDNDASESKPSETEQKPAADSNEQQPAEQASESEQKSSEQTNDSDMKDDNSIKQVGESYQGKNKEGESKEDPEKALKDSRGGAGLNTLEPENPKPKPENLPIVCCISPTTKHFANKPRMTSTAISPQTLTSSRRKSPRATSPRLTALSRAKMVQSRRVRIVLSKCPATS